MRIRTEHKATAGLVVVGALAIAVSRAAVSAEPAPPPMPAQHTVGCTAYDADIASELNILAEPGTPVATSTTASEPGPVLAPGKTYLVALNPQSQVKLAVAPRRPVLEEGAHAGMMSLKPAEDGTWRVSTSRETWIEVVGPDGAALKSSRFQGREGCPDMRKFVEFPLKAGATYTLQLSGGVDPDMKVLVTGPVTAQS